MADNRGLPSATSSKSIDGLHKTKSIDMNTLNMMDKVYGKYASFIKDSFGSLEGFEKILDKSSKEMTDLMQKQKKDADERSETMKEMMEQYDKNSKEMKLVRKEMEKENKIAKEELAKKQDETMKNFIKQSFKNESSNKQIKYLNNKYSKGNNLAKTSNEYYDELAKLKSDALDAFGASFENTKGYRKALENLNDKYASDMKDAWKEDFKENHKVLGGIAGGIKDTFERNKKELQGLLGPLNLIIGPMQEFFGGFGKIFSLASGGVKWLFKKFTKKNPTATDVLKSGASGVGALYIANKLEDIFGSTQGGGESLLDTLKDMPSVMGNLSSILGKMGGKLAGAAGIGMMGFDAFMGAGKAEEWNTSKVAASIAAALGGTGSGFGNAAKNALKGALLGASFGPWGILIGGLMGGVLGYFGGESLIDVVRFLKADERDSVIKKKRLESYEKDYKKGKYSKEFYDVITKLADDPTIDASTFVSMTDKNKSGLAIADMFTSGKLNALSPQELATYLGGSYGVNLYKGNDIKKGADTSKIENLKKILNWSKGTISSKKLQEMYKDPMKFGAYLNALNELQVDLITGMNESDILRKYNMNSKVLEYLKSQGIQDISTNFRYTDKGHLDWNSLDNVFASEYTTNKVDDAIIRADGSIIKTNPKDTLVALKNIPLSMEKARMEANKNLGGFDGNNSLEKKLNTIIDVLSKILSKDLKVEMPPQTRQDLDLIMCGGMV